MKSVNMTQERNSYWREYAVAICATLSFFAGGSSFGWTSPTLPILTDKSKEGHLTMDQASWVVSLYTLSSAISPIPTAVMIDKIGRKKTLLISGIPYVISWIIIMLNTSATWLYVSRLISGWGYGIIFSVTPVYLSEICSKEVRGSIGVIMTITTKSGVLLAYSVGAYTSILEHAAVQILIPIIFLLTFFWCPESPYYLLLRKQELQAERSLQQLRGKTDVKQELDEISASIKSNQGNRAGYKDLFRTRGNRRGIIIMFTLACCTHLCGSQSVIAYSQNIFQEAGGVLDPKVATIILGLMQLVSSVTASTIVDKFGRRPLLLISTIGVMVMDGAIGTYFFFKDYLESDMSSVNWMPIVLILIYIVAYNIGLSAIVFMMVGEIFPTNVKAVAASSFMTLMSLLIFAVTKLYQVMSDGLGTYASFWIFGSCTAIGLVFMIIFVPETKGKSLAQIQIDMNRINK